ncbi:hypothetical protein [Dyadobacter sp. OTU695]|uniref:hypothetical protein n=1 Tax=Dyadobacter sp. OTU695 TaxID=3043860 RepID=UPI00313E8116
MKYLIVIILATLGQASFAQTTSSAEYRLSTSDLRLHGTIPSKSKITGGNGKFDATTIFRVTDINPLKYRYTVNNVVISHFTDATTIDSEESKTISGNGVVNPDIVIPDIFSTDTTKSQIRKKLAEFNAKRVATADSLRKVSKALQGLYMDLARITKYSPPKSVVAHGHHDVKLDQKTNTGAETKEKTEKEREKEMAAAEEKAAIEVIRKRRYLDSLFIVSNEKYRKLSERLRGHSFDRSIQIQDYIAYIRKLPILNLDNAIIRRLMSTVADTATLYYSIDVAKQEFANDFKNRYSDFDTLENFLAHISAQPHDMKNGLQNKHFLELEKKYKLDWERPAVGEYHGISVEESLSSLREQILEKRFQIYQDYVLLVATNIGMLVQDHAVKYATFHNEVLALNSIDSTMLHRINVKTQKLRDFLIYVRQTDADMQMLMSYLDVNVALYEKIATNVNKNSILLNKILTSLGTVQKSTTSENLMPTTANFGNCDVLRFVIRREEVASKDIKVSEYVYEYWLKGGLKVDFSVGFFGSRLLDDVFNKVLISTDTSGVDSIQIKRQNAGRADFAFGGMVNIVRRNGEKWVNGGLSFGVAYAGNKSLQALASVAVHLGKSERIILHAGCAFGLVKRLDLSANNFISDGNNIIVKSKDISYSSFNIPYYQRFEGKMFFGITYNLSKKNALSAVSGAGLDTYNSRK